MNWSSFFYDNFISGWNNPEHYNWFSTLAYAVIALLLVTLSYRVMRKKIVFSYATVFEVLPFIILGCIVRVFADYGVYPRFFWTVTPGVWIIFLVLIVCTLLLDAAFKTKGLITIILPTIGIIPHLFYFRIINPTAALYFAFFYVLSLIPFILLRKKFKLLNDEFNFAAIASQLFDATSSFVNVDFFHYVEIHVIGGFFADVFNTGFVMYPLKLIVLLPVLYYLDKETDINFKNYLKLIICVLGLGPGIRNLITVLLGV
ncbi:Uncharacterised protein [Candidatus Tiddalikarchaeum anstoanum]|nr:Uncharacterised protein [Candidatus Tiddalikarchaeum anstoanum]